VYVVHFKINWSPSGLVRIQIDKNSLFSYYKQLKSYSVESFLLPGLVQMLCSRNTTISFKDMFDLSVVLCKMHTRYSYVVAIR